MSEHFPESAIGGYVYSWCSKCCAFTKHEIVRHTEHASRKGPCLEHKAQELTQAQKKRRERTAAEIINRGFEFPRE